ncbi:MAG: PH domain-containing protein [Firmicutes bacterium]|nr:PH domain-containing protein [Bacillota bacterium]
MIEELRRTVGTDERIMWEGRPNKKCFIFESIFNPLLPFAIVWGLFDLFFFKSFFAVENTVKSVGASDIGLFGGSFILVFLLFHLMPVWIYLGGVIMSSRRYKNTAYIVTDKAVYLSSGIISRTINRKPFAELSHVNLHRGFFDQKFGVGDIVLSSTTAVSTNGAVMPGITIASISEYNKVYDLVKKIQTDIYSDTMYPNDMRPKENHGYNTEYKGM